MALWAAGGVTASAAPLKAGAAAIDLTPPAGLPMWGYAARHDAPATGTREPLFARAAVIEAGGTRVALVGLDLGRAPVRAAVARIRERATALGVSEVFLNGSHTHHGPVIELEDIPRGGVPYTRTLEDRIVGAIQKSVESLEPATLALAAADVPLNRNRQWKRENPPVDRRLTVVCLNRADGGAIATLVHFAAHPTMVPGGVLEWSPDYPGFTCAKVAASRGGVCVFLQGASGDLSTTGGDARVFGERLAGEALKLAASARPEEPGRPRWQTSRDELRFRARLPLTNPIVQLALGRAFFPELIPPFEREFRDGVRPELTVGVLNQRLAFVGVSGELFCAHAIRLRERATVPHVLLLGCTNGHHMYFPTIEAVAAGGYGTEPHVALAEVGAGERLTDKALLRLEWMKGRVATTDVE